MAYSTAGLLLAVAAVGSALFAGASAQFSGCTSSIVSLAPCLGYISGNSSTPSATCCSQLSAVVKSAPQCLCLVLNGGAAQYGLTINQTQALMLPGACSVQTPPISACNALAGPAASPAPATTTATGGVRTSSGNTTPYATGGGSSLDAPLSLAAAFLLVLYAAGGIASL